MKTKKCTIAILIDFTKAFDLIWHEGLLYKMRKFGLTGRTYKCILDFLTDRTIQVRVGTDLSSIKNMEIGTPQGSVISPLLFLIMIAYFPESPTLQTSLIVDDSSVWKSGGSMKHIKFELQSHLNKIAKWCTDWGFVTNSKKTVSIIFTNKRKYNQPHIPARRLAYRIREGCKIPRYDLRRQPELERARHLYKKQYGLCAQLGRRHTPLLAIYRALVRSVIDYGLELNSSASKSTMKMLESIQAQCL